MGNRSELASLHELITNLLGGPVSKGEPHYARIYESLERALLAAASELAHQIGVSWKTIIKQAITNPTLADALLNQENIQTLVAFLLKNQGLNLPNSNSHLEEF